MLAQSSKALAGLSSMLKEEENGRFILRNLRLSSKISEKVSFAKLQILFRTKNVESKFNERPSEETKVGSNPGHDCQNGQSVQRLLFCLYIKISCFNQISSFSARDDSTRCGPN